MEKFNHYMMMLARDSRGLTQEELSARLAVGQGTFSKYETGIKEPPLSFVAELSAALGYPESFFYESGRSYGLPPFHYRRRKKLAKKALARIVAEMNIRRLHIEKLLRSFEQITGRIIPEIDRDEYMGKSKGPLSIEDVARAIREMWMLPAGPIPNMVSLIESNGGIIVPCDFGTDLLDAMSQRIDGLPVLFFVNMGAPTDRLRHTLAHELGHVILHTTVVKDDEEMEDEADEFAGAFLLPADEVRPQLRKFNLRQLANMKLYWKVSMAGIAVRATRLNLITPYQSKMFWMEMSKLGYRRREPNEPPKEVPSVLRQMIAFHMNGLGYSVSEMAKLLHLLVSEFQSMYGAEALGGLSARPALRVVK
jgi:Zn-dependent peptidase ImmA (M78 family)/DNA-binding XRE family transcriptional regulator